MTGTTRAAILGHVVSVVLLAASAVYAADPIRVPRYDDADDFLPNAERRNKDNVRLFLRQQEGEELFKVLTPRNVTVDVVSRVPPNANAALVILIGGSGVLSIANDRLDRSFGFPTRSRDFWWAYSIATFVVDAPSDRLGKDGILDPVWRAGPQHTADLEAVVKAVADRFNGPIVIWGHSNGAMSVANAASLRHKQVKLYLHSGPAHINRGTNFLGEVEYTAPVFVLQHAKDGCNASLSKDVESFMRNVKAPSKKLTVLDGGSDALSGACGAFAPHSFFGMEKTAIDTLAQEVRSALE